MRQQTEEYVDKFWELIDSIINSVLFVLIGLALLLIDFEPGYWLICLVVIGLVLLARFISIRLPFRLAVGGWILTAKLP